MNRDIANQLLEDYYDERGWDKEIGTPSSYKLKELGLTRYI
ncbi:MAG: aldehyde ferredoxin oxidoreductase C-terminal domain-containing protein [Promethearchaeota archaeon]